MFHDTINNQDYTFEFDAYSCQKMWNAIIDQAFLDIQCTNLNTVRRRNFMAACDWFLKGELDFQDICNYAGQDHVKVRDNALSILFNHPYGRRVLVTKYKFTMIELRRFHKGKGQEVSRVFRRNGSNKILGKA